MYEGLTLRKVRNTRIVASQWATRIVQVDRISEKTNELVFQR
ncbi:hypothetical protein SAMN04488125_101123 [Methylorubrum salsuginis]|uniref:Uncharacterized protein n=1 Tax=Methylorubrum salsuginis TaxID=414703 RepID=A0A1I3YB78_9HYPH|nr:hypothetical protein SAMN04488125_101123 [Methylorubrum salsuginis]